MTESSSASTASTPAQFMNAMTNSWMSRQFASRRSWASICSPHRRSAIGVARAPSGISNESASECAGSVLMMSVRDPAAAARTAVADATVVLATGPTTDAAAAPGTAEIYAVYLEPERVGSGVGRELFGTAVRNLRHVGFSRALLWVLESNDRARRFYGSAGWTMDDAVKDEDWY